MDVDIGPGHSSQSCRVHGGAGDGCHGAFATSVTSRRRADAGCSAHDHHDDHSCPLPGSPDRRRLRRRQPSVRRHPRPRRRERRHREFGDGDRFIFTPCWRCSLLCLVAQLFLVFRLLGELLRPMWQMLWNYQPALLGLRFVVSFLILLMPTTAMGLTLPVLIEDPMLRQTNFGRAIGFLYGSNTLGAVAGAVLGEGYLIAAFGLRGTSLAAGLASCIAAAAALLYTNSTGDTAANALAANVSASRLCQISAAVASAFRQLWNGLHSSCRWK